MCVRYCTSKPLKDDCPTSTVSQSQNPLSKSLCIQQEYIFLFSNINQIRLFEVGIDVVDDQRTRCSNSGSKPSIPLEIIDIDSWVLPPSEIIDVDAWQPTPKKALTSGQILITSNLSYLGLHINQHQLACAIVLARTGSSSTVLAYNQLFINSITQDNLNTNAGIFTCSICQQLLANLVGLPCNKTICHIFCFHCLHCWLYELQGKGCPLCCADIKIPMTCMKNLQVALKALPSDKDRAKNERVDSTLYIMLLFFQLSNSSPPNVSFQCLWALQKQRQWAEAKMMGSHRWGTSSPGAGINRGIELGGCYIRVRRKPEPENSRRMENSRRTRIAGGTDKAVSDTT
ncbi:hypothetical protein B0H14DRAFT_3686864 [Mycena olivaceomarginata]|nr:hypothetical protein B0H14DRAFT_3686864 [Mycena olivaceomarginata]